MLVVDDEPGLADLYAAWLDDRYDPDIMYSGTNAQDRLLEGRYDAGHYLRAEAYGQLIETDEGPEVVGITRDVTGRSGEESSER